MRAKNDGHLYFFMRPDGTPFALDDDGQPQNIPLDADAASNFSDLFCAKGMIAGARLLADEAALREATDYAQRVSADLRPTTARPDKPDRPRAGPLRPRAVYDQPRHLRLERRHRRHTSHRRGFAPY
jgi:hypothetical protein